MPLTEYDPVSIEGNGRVMKKTQDYLGTFARFQTTEAIHAVERYPPPPPHSHSAL
jgi:hypothetical protein